MFKYIYIWLFLFSTIHGIAQQPASIHLTEKDGLPDIEFYNIIEDTKQFIWLAADNGLYRYDGKNYKHYTHKLQKGNAVFGTFEDSKGRIWCNNISGQFFYVENDKMHLFKDLSKQLKGVLPEFIVTDTQLFVFPMDNIISVDLKDKNISYQFSDGMFIGNVFKFENSYIYTQNNDIVKRDKQFNIINKTSVDIFDNYDEKAGMSRRVSMINSNDLTLCYFLQFKKNSFYKIDLEASISQQIEIPKELFPRTISHVFLNDKDLWFSTDLGLFICNYRDGKIRLKKHLLKSHYVTKVIKDSHSNYWITTKDDGIFVFPNISISQFNFINLDNSLSQIEKINDSTLIYGTSKGQLGLINVNNGTSKILDTTSAYRITKIINNKDTSQAIIAKEDKAITYNTKTKILEEINPIFSGLKDISYVGNNYVVSTYRAVELMDINFNFVKPLMWQRSYTNHYSKKNNAIYVACVDGFYYFDENFNLREIKDKSSSLYIKSITETKDGTIWVASFKNGIYALKDNKIVLHLTDEAGLLTNKITQIKNDDNLIWIASSNGVQLYNPKDKNYKNLTKRNGIPSYRITDIEIIDNQAYFASNVGLFVINKKNAFKTPQHSELYITNVTVNSKKYDINSKYDLDYNQNTIKIGFNVNGFQSYEYTKYQYRLIGLETKWQTTDNHINTVSYNGLRSGNYSFEIKLVGNSNSIKTINFRIAKPFWITWWFFVFVALMIGLAIYTVFVLKIRKLKLKQTEILQKELLNKQLIFSQLENLRSQMNPHFIFNALNSIQEYIVLNEKDLASTYLTKFSRLIRIYLDHSRENEILLSEELKALQIYLELEKNRFEDLLEYTISIDKDLKPNTIKIPSLFIQPYVENALKHGLLHKKKDRNLNISFNLNNTQDILICVIEDNGIGIEASKKINKYRNQNHKSFATNANEKRVSLINTNRKYKIKVETINLGTTYATGTRVVITIPFSNN